MQKLINKIVSGDCIEILSKVRKPFADLIFADPPFNIGYQYDHYKDKLKKDKYIAWTKDWMTVCKKVLKPHGSFYIAIGDDYVANIKLIADELELEMRNWIIWHYTFGQQMKNKFARAHTHILYFVNDKNKFTFNDDVGRVFSDRQTKYYDKRANPDGKLPDDVWDEFPRVCGTFEERTGWHPCQMPESILARIIHVSSNPGEVILDPFSGSGTTCVVAYKLKRKYAGIEISPKYVEETRKRIQASEVGAIEEDSEVTWNTHFDSELKWIYHENKITTEQLGDDDNLLNLFTLKFSQRIGQVCTPKKVKKRLIQLRQSVRQKADTPCQ